MNEEEFRRTVIDGEQLRFLALGYKVSAGFAALYSMFGLFYVFLGVVFSVASSQSTASGASDPPPAFMGLVFGGMGLAIMTVGLTIAVLKWVTARRLEQRRSRGFCQFVAAVSCLEIPYGTMLGVLTFVALGRPSVRAQFGGLPELRRSPNGGQFG